MYSVCSLTGVTHTVSYLSSVVPLRITNSKLVIIISIDFSAWLTHIFGALAQELNMGTFQQLLIYLLSQVPICYLNSYRFKVLFHGTEMLILFSAQGEASQVYTHSSVHESCCPFSLGFTGFALLVIWLCFLHNSHSKKGTIVTPFVYISKALRKE